MDRKEAYAWHDRALEHIRAAEAIARADAAAEGKAKESLAVEIDIGIAVEAYPDGESRVVVKIQSEDTEAARQAVEVMRELGSIPADALVEFIGPMRGFGPADMVSPVQPGVSCAHATGPRGTLGCIVKNSGATRFLLSCNHVIAREDNVDLGTPIVQPVSGVDEFRTIGTLKKAIPLMAAGNKMDAAIAELTINDFTATQFNGKSIVQLRTAPLLTGDPVFKFGQFTHDRSGRVQNPIASNIKLNMSFGSYKFDEQIEIEAPAASPFADGGDSGALVYDDHDRAVGIVIGGDGITKTYVTPIARVLGAFTMTLA